MFLNNFKKCLTSNLIAVCGYIIFVLSSYFLFISNPKASVLDKMYPDGDLLNHAYNDAIIPYVANLTIIYYLILFLLLILIVELYLHHKNKIKYLKIFEKKSKIKEILFWIGYLLIPFPAYIFFIALVWLLLSLN